LFFKGIKRGFKANIHTSVLKELMEISEKELEKKLRK